MEVEVEQISVMTHYGLDWRNKNIESHENLIKLLPFM